MADETILVERREEVEAQLASFSERETALEASLRDDLPALSRAQDTWFALSGLRERLRGTQSLAAERLRNAASAEAEPTESGRDPDQLEAEAAQVREQEQVIGAEVETHRTALEQAVTGRRTAEEAAAEEERRVAGLVRAAADRREGLARLHGQVNALRTRAAAADDEIGRLRDARQEAAARADRAQRDFTALETKVAGLDAGEEGLDAEHESAIALLDDVTARLEKARDEVQLADRERSALAARKEALEMGLNRRDGAGALLAATDQVSGLLGSVAALLSVRPGYETAVAAALGSAADAVAVADPDAAIAAIDHLKTHDLGRAGLVLGGGPSRTRAAWPGLPSHASYAVDAVECPDELRASLVRLLHKVAVVDDLAAARALVADLPDVTAVTREGDVLGAVRGRGRVELAAEPAGDPGRGRRGVGPAGGGDGGQRAARVRHLAARERAARRPAARRRRAGQAARVRRDAGRGGRAAGSVRLAGPLGARRGRAPRHGDRQRRDRARPGPRRPRRPRAAAGRPPSRPPTRSPTPPSASGSPRRPAPPAVARRRPGWRCAPPRSAAARCTAAPTRCWRRRRPSATPAPGPPSAASGWSARAGRPRPSAPPSPSCSPGWRSRCTGPPRSGRRSRPPGASASRSCSPYAPGSASSAAEHDELVSSVHRDEMARTQQKMRIEQLAERAIEELGLDVDGLVAEYGPANLVPPTAPVEDGVRRTPCRTCARSSRSGCAPPSARWRCSGRVNPLALEEFSAMEERHKFLTEQLEDLKKTRKDLLDIVREVDARVEQVFTEAYADVAAAFDSTFTRLFPGGEGRLVLTDPDDMLNTGIEVEARPAGKKVKRLSLLSGGERSLVAVAFLVALFKARPSPFYILDEVEAALDDTNLGRLLEIYEELRENSQLLVITHQKRTMEVGDALYGVTMRGDGVSAVISQRLREAESA